MSNLPDSIVWLTLYVALPLAVAILIFDTIGGPEFIYWLIAK